MILKRTNHAAISHAALAAKLDERVKQLDQVEKAIAKIRRLKKKMRILTFGVSDKALEQA